MKSVIQNIRGFSEKLLRAAQRVLGSRMRTSELRLRTTALNLNFMKKYMKSTPIKGVISTS